MLSWAPVAWGLLEVAFTLEQKVHGSRGLLGIFMWFHGLHLVSEQQATLKAVGLLINRSAPLRYHVFFCI